MMSSTNNLAVEVVPTPKIGWKSAARLRTLSVLMPAYNERLTLQRILNRVLSAPIALDLEIVVVDDGSTDGSWELLQELAQDEPRIRPIRHARNRGKGAAIRTAIEHMTGDVAVIQDADLEYDPHELPKLLELILSGQADAVFGSRLRGENRRAMHFWHALANSCLTLLSNVIFDLNLTDMETCYKMVRAEVLRNLTLRGERFNIEPELTGRLAQWGGPIFEVPVSYAGRTYDEGKKVGLRDGFQALFEMLRCGFVDRRFTNHAGFYILTAMARAEKYNRWRIEKVQPYLGKRLLEAGAGIGNFSKLLLNRERLVLIDSEDLYVSRLHRRFGHFGHVHIAQADLTQPADFERLLDEELDTIVSFNVLQHIEPDQTVLDNFFRVLQPGGHCVVGVPAGMGFYTGADAELGHYRRYEERELRRKLEAAGFEIVHSERFNRLGALAWWISGKVFRRRTLSPRQILWFDRMVGVVKLLEHVLPVPGMSLLVVGRRPEQP